MNPIVSTNQKPTIDIQNLERKEHKHTERVNSRQVDNKSRGPQGERGLEFSRRKKGQTFFPPLHSLGLLYNI